MGEAVLRHSVLDKINLYFLFVKLIAKSNLQYRFNTLAIAFAVLCREGVNIAAIYFLFHKFSDLQGWKINELFFLYSFLFLSYSLVTFLFTGIRDFESMVHKGDLDRLFIRPLGLLFQVIVSKSDYAATIGHGAIGIVLFVISANSVNIEWNLTNIIFLLLVIIGGVLIQASLFMISSSLGFWTIKIANIRNMIFFNTRRFAGYPISIYPAFIRMVIIYVVPFAFVNYFPAQFFLRKSDGLMFSSLFFYLTPFVGLSMFIFANAFWGCGVRRYSSVGN